MIRIESCREAMPTFNGSITPTGKSEAIRLDKVTGFLAVLENDLKRHPGRRTGLSKTSLARAVRLTRKVKVKDTEVLPAAVTF
jgi:hypothetical protein